jgi:hypothetical protein
MKTISFTDEEIEYLGNKLTISRFTLEDCKIAQDILEKLGLIEVIKLQRKKRD